MVARCVAVLFLSLTARPLLAQRPDYTPEQLGESPAEPGREKPANSRDKLRDSAAPARQEPRPPGLLLNQGLKAH